mmetsp:Transcript_37272/g.94516  ORF Transcript_37272/g.94516 Transcript_37272/m.94516 type:complete len:200 (-) Transcript_37272:102-701(-)
MGGALGRCGAALLGGRALALAAHRLRQHRHLARPRPPRIPSRLRIPALGPRHRAQPGLPRRPRARCAPSHARPMVQAPGAAARHHAAVGRRASARAAGDRRDRCVAQHLRRLDPVVGRRAARLAGHAAHARRRRLPAPQRAPASAEADPVAARREAPARLLRRGAAGAGGTDRGAAYRGRHHPRDDAHAGLCGQLRALR